MSARSTAPLLVAAALSFAAGYAVGSGRPAPRPLPPETPPETVEVYRPACGPHPEVADTVRVYSDEVAPSGRPAYTLRMRFGDRVVTLKGEAVNLPRP